MSNDEYQTQEFWVKTDLESFGWIKKHIKEENIKYTPNESYTKNSYTLLDFNMEDHYIEIFNKGECIFKGCIKNKSELKKLMQQLGIYE